MVSGIRYARSQSTRIAYQVLGSGKKVLILINGWVSNLEEGWLLPGVSEWLAELGSFSRLILFDKRGVGLSDRVHDEHLPNLAERVDDLRAVMDQEGIQKATLLGLSEGGPMALQFCATFPERVESLILYGSYACWKQADDYPAGLPLALHQKTLQAIDQHWGQAIGLPLMAPSVAGDATYQKAWAAFLRKSASPSAAKALYQMNLSIDVRHLLTGIRLPVMVLHREGDKLIPLPMGQYLADHIPQARLVTFRGADHFPWLGDSHSLVAAIGEFMGETIPVKQAVPLVGTLVGVEISTGYAQNHLIEGLERSGGSPGLAASGLLTATFGSPEAALSSLHGLAGSAQTPLPRMAVHTGVYRRNGQLLEGPAVSWLARVLPTLEPGHVWVSQPARHLLSGLYYAFSQTREVHLPIPPFLVPVYACTAPAPDKRHYQSVLQGGKLREADISVLLSIRRHLEAHYLSDCTLTGISRTFGINTFKLKYGFKALFGVSVIQFVLDLRLEHAHQLVLHSGMPLAEVSDIAGYQQPGNFSKAFHKKYGSSPADLRKRAGLATHTG